MRVYGVTRGGGCEEGGDRVQSGLGGGVSQGLHDEGEKM